jgi:capsular polysaccharide transport system ATP-binding protein
MHPVLTGEENCRFIARIYGASAKSVLEFVADFSELGFYLKMPVDTYSSGMRARLAFAISMAIEFDVYLVDEITAVGDKRFQAKCRAAFQERQARSSVVMVSHSPGTIKAYCDRAAVLQDGILEVFENVREAEKYYETKLFDGMGPAKNKERRRSNIVKMRRKRNRANRTHRAR